MEPCVRGRFRGMQTNQLSPDTLRRLAELRPEEGKVVSIYLNLDPTEFANGAAPAPAPHPPGGPAAATPPPTPLPPLGAGAAGGAGEEDSSVREDVERIRDVFAGF